MSQHPRRNRSMFSLCSMVLAAAVMTGVPTWANAHEPANSDAKASRRKAVCVKARGADFINGSSSRRAIARRRRIFA